MFTNHRVAHLSTLNFVPDRDIDAGNGPVVIQRVMLNHGPTTTPCGDLLCVSLREHSRIGTHY